MEGGGDRAELHSECRRAFQALIEKAGFKGRMPKFTAMGPRGKAFSAFCRAHTAAGQGEFPVLLVDSEEPVAEASRWAHLRARDKWEKPDGVEEDQAQLMVQCMETWIVADRGTLREFFGQGFRVNALPAMNELENRSKEDVQNGLERATENCKGPYKKGKRSFRVLAELDPDVLKKKHLSHFERLCGMLERRLAL